MPTILVVDDERPLQRALAANLGARGFGVLVASTGEEALRVASRHHPDAVILDLGLPGMDGIEVIAGLRGWTLVPIIVLSARGAEADKVAALDAGADDYVAKPFGMDELLARLRAALRRSSAALTTETPTIQTEDFTIDFGDRRVTDPSGSPIKLTPTEWGILEMLARNEGRLVTQKQLLQEVWGPEYGAESNYLRVHMTNLRRKVEPNPAQPRYLITEPGMGYRFMGGPSSTG